jgi:hypothetical protein
MSMFEKTEKIFKKAFLREKRSPEKPYFIRVIGLFCRFVKKIEIF